MTDKRKDLVRQLGSLMQSQDKLQKQLREAQADLFDLQGKINTGILENGEAEGISELSSKRDRIESLKETLAMVEKNILDTRQGIDDIDMVSRGGVIMELDKKVQQAVVDLQAKIGEKGLKNQIDQLGALIAELERLNLSDVKVHGVAEHVYSARIVHDQLSHSLFETWKDIEALHWGPGHSPASSRPNYIPGFGVRPGFLIA